MTRSIFVLKLESIRGDGIHGLRAILKSLLRRHGFKCVSAHEEQIPNSRKSEGSEPDRC